MKRVLSVAVCVLVFVFLFFVLPGFALEQNLPVLAVVAFQNSTGVQMPDLSNMGLQLLESALLGSGNFILADRSTIQQSLTEIGFNTASGLVDPSTAIQLGKMLGARYLAMGNIVDITTKTTEFSGYGIRTKRTALSMTVGLRVVDAEKGLVFFIAQASASRENLPQEVFDPASSKISLSTYQELMQEAIAQLVKQFSEKVLALEKAEEAPVEKVTIPVNSDPQGADVEIGGLFVGNTPMELELEKGRVVEITISLAGYTPWTKKIEAREGLTINARLGKEVPKESLKVEEKPAGVETEVTVEKKE
jgi:curli biogenesis system outer membrane secretion channel CsgG